MVATIAFGMGIDKPDVRFVAHLDLPQDPSRATTRRPAAPAATALPADAWMAYGLGDVVQQRRMIDTRRATTPSAAVSRTQARRAARPVRDRRSAAGRSCSPISAKRAPRLRQLRHLPAPPQVWDGTVAAQKFLSAVYRLARERGQKFGAGHLIDILRGKKTPKVAEFGHDRLTVFGVGADLREPEWRGVARQLLAQGLLGVEGDFGVLTLTGASAAVLRQEREIMLRREPERVRAPRPGRSSRAGTAAGAAGGTGGADLTPEAAKVFERLREWRAGTAREQNVPAYVIFHDATLRQIAAEKPATLTGLSGINGVGEAKLAKYGQQVLDVLGRLDVTSGTSSSACRPR